MQRYFRTAKAVTQLNTIVLQNLGAAIFPAFDAPPGTDQRSLPGGARAARCARSRTFRARAARDSRGVPAAAAASRAEGHDGAYAARAVARAPADRRPRSARDPANRATFMDILRQPRGLVHKLRRMNQYGVLGRYLPAFGRIVGQMQHDLFHVYTVDEHILTVVRNLRRFTMPEFAHEYPLLQPTRREFRAHRSCFTSRPVPRHRQGPRRRPFEARAWRTRAGSAARTVSAATIRRLVELLVEHHLTMSAIAQKQDLSDPDVIRRVRREGRRRATPGRAVPADGRRHPRHQPEGVECLERESCSKTCSGATPRAARNPVALPAENTLQAKQDRALRQLRLYATVRTRHRELWSSSTIPISCATTSRRSSGTRACIYRVNTDARWSRRGSRRSARGCR